MGLFTSLPAALRCMRPKQWTKNAFVFAGLIFTDNFTNPRMVALVCAGFFAFCLLSGAVYLINDIRDVESDRLHPRKRLRPIAAGQLSVPMAATWSVILIPLGLAIAFLLGWEFGLTALAYLALNVLYSFRLRHVVLLDIFSIAFGFVLRAFGGLEIIRHIAPDTEITDWFILCTFFLALFLAVCKRRHEALLLSASNLQHRKVLDEYTPALLDQMVAVTTTSTIICYGLWSAVTQFKEQHMVLTLPFVVFGIFRYLYIVYKLEEGGEPEQTLLKDWPLLICIGLWLVAVIILMAFNVPMDVGGG